MASIIFDALRLLLVEFRPELRSCCRQYEQRDRRAEEDEFERHAPGRKLRISSSNTCMRPKASSRLWLPARRQPEEQDQHGYDRQQPEILRICESKTLQITFYGILFSTRFENRNSSTTPDPPYTRAGTAPW